MIHNNAKRSRFKRLLRPFSKGWRSCGPSRHLGGVVRPTSAAKTITRDLEQCFGFVG